MMLSFKEFQALNRKRCEEAFHLVKEDRWPFDRWCLCLAGEVGELCNFVKKVLRTPLAERPGLPYDPSMVYTKDERREMLAELADIITYADLAISHLGADTGEVLMSKFRQVSERMGWELKPTEEFMDAMGEADRAVEETLEPVNFVGDELIYHEGDLVLKCDPFAHFDVIEHVKKLEARLKEQVSTPGSPEQFASQAAALPESYPEPGTETKAVYLCLHGPPVTAPGGVQSEGFHKWLLSGQSPREQRWHDAMRYIRILHSLMGYPAWPGANPARRREKTPTVCAVCNHDQSFHPEDGGCIKRSGEGFCSCIAFK